MKTTLHPNTVYTPATCGSYYFTRLPGTRRVSAPGFSIEGGYSLPGYGPNLVVDHPVDLPPGWRVVDSTLYAPED